MLIREATSNDIPSIFDIRFSVIENVLSDPKKVTVEICNDFLNRRGKGWVVEVDETVAGFSIASLEDGSIWALFVRPGFEGRGVGRELLKKAKDWLFAAGASEVHLTTEPGTRADGFYSKQGWSRGETTPEGEVRFSIRRT